MILSINFNKVFIDVIGFENNFVDVSIPIIQYLYHNGYILVGKEDNIYSKGKDIFMIHQNSKFKPTEN
mgnify:CR=1 FL=1